MFQATIPHPFILEGNDAPDTVQLRVDCTASERMSFLWKLMDSDGKTVIKSETPAIKAEDQLGVHITFPTIACEPGDYTVRTTGVMPNGTIQSMDLPIHIMKRANPWSAPPDAKLELQPVATIVPKPDMPSESFAKMGAVHLASLNGRQYLETDNDEGSRFVLRAKLPDADSIYLLEWDYPDDKVRSVDVVAQESLGIVVNIDYSDESFAMLPKEIKEAGVLSHGSISVGRIISWRFVVTNQ